MGERPSTRLRHFVNLLEWWGMRAGVVSAAHTNRARRRRSSRSGAMSADRSDRARSPERSSPARPAGRPRTAGPRPAGGSPRATSSCASPRSRRTRARRTRRPTPTGAPPRATRSCSGRPATSTSTSSTGCTMHEPGHRPRPGRHGVLLRAGRWSPASAGASRRSNRAAPPTWPRARPGWPWRWTSTAAGTAPTPARRPAHLPPGGPRPAGAVRGGSAHRRRPGTRPPLRFWLRTTRPSAPTAGTPRAPAADSAG